MASQDHIRNPIEWGWDQITLATLTVGSLGRSLGGSEESRNAPLPAVYRIKVTDLRDAVVRGLDDFGAYRTDVIFLCLIYPLVGISLAWLTFGYETLPLLFPLASGFALVGPVLAVGLYEMSRRREQGISITWKPRSRWTAPPGTTSNNSAARRDAGDPRELAKGTSGSRLSLPHYPLRNPLGNSLL